MHRHNLYKQIASLQRRQVNAGVESVAVSLFAVITAVLLPQLVFQYLVETNPDALENTVALQYIPHAAYALAALVFVVMIVGNFLRNRRINRIEQELSVLAYTEDAWSCNCDCNCDGCEPANHYEIEPMPEVMEESPKAKKTVAKSKKTAGKAKSSKKSA